MTQKLDDAPDSALLEIAPEKPKTTKVEELPEIILQEKIREMKQLGMERPPTIPAQRWFAPGELNARHELLFYRKAMGETTKQAALIAGFDYRYALSILSKVESQNRVRELQEVLFGKDIRKQMSTFAGKAFDVVDKMLEGGEDIKDSVQADMAKYILDQIVGKSKQEVQVQGNLLYELVTQLKNQERDVVATAQPVDASDDPIDAFVNEVVPKTTKVGDRGKQT